MSAAVGCNRLVNALFSMQRDVAQFQLYLILEYIYILITINSKLINFCDSETNRAGYSANTTVLFTFRTEYEKLLILLILFFVGKQLPQQPASIGIV